MSLFSEKLSCYIRESGMTLQCLSSFCGLDITYISKIKKGERLPRKKAQVTSLIESLRLSPSEKQDLWDAYAISLIGDDQFRINEAVRDLLSTIYSPEPVCSSHSTLSQMTETSVAYGQTSVNIMVKSVLELESAKEDGFVQMVLQPDYHFAIDLLCSLALKRTGPVVKHIFCLDPSPNADAVIQNIDDFRMILPLLSADLPYQANYYYDQHPSSRFQMDAMPFFIVTSEYTITLSSDYCLAELSSNKERLRLYRHIFQDLLTRTSDLISPLSGSQLKSSLEDTNSKYITGLCSKSLLSSEKTMPVERADFEEFFLINKKEIVRQVDHNQSPAQGFAGIMGHQKNHWTLFAFYKNNRELTGFLLLEKNLSFYIEKYMEFLQL